MKLIWVGKTLAFILLVLVLHSFRTEAQVVNSINVGTPALSYSAATIVVGNGTTFAVPGRIATITTWQSSFTTAPTSLTLLLQGSLDNVSWFTLDTSTVVTGSLRTIGPNAVKFVRCRVDILTVGPGLGVTCSINLATM